ncbi:sirohydrochlorin chelatase [Paenibacillus sp. 481]|uniref:sirohydrochlorin chelatase n=1 Tax=Paenibacillus sp. 481 TaxID=2835869 RepID=UPI001E4A4B5F|nr:CbiX/SirB N-terminal domain-containing protein [Paenibacillus sp. 481]UHA74714.1 hypothetical protein KIK04_06480 [Paenibacillus sp. 481]
MDKPGLLVISHGSRSAAWVALVDEAIAQANWPEGIPVVSSFLECVPGRSIQDGIDELEAIGVNAIGVLPLFVSSGSTHVDEIAYALGVKAESLVETDLEPFAVRARIYYGQPLDGDEAVLDMLASRLKGLRVAGERDGVLLIAHGSPHEPFQTRWHEGLSHLGRMLLERGLCAYADHALLCCEDVAGAARQLRVRTEAMGGQVVVVPLFLSTGYFTNQVIPERLSGETVEYDGQTLLPHPALSVWLEQEALRVLDTMHESSDSRPVSGRIVQQ